MILAGDIGGTHTRLALFDADPHEPLALTVYPSRKHAGLEEIVAAFLTEHPADLEGACFDVAGPVLNGWVKTTNLPWMVDARRVADGVGLRSVELVNDLAATAYGIGELTTSDLETLNIGSGIAPHILPKLRQHSFLDSLTAKGRFRAMLEQIPVHVILNERTGPLGAARIARREPPHIHRA
jgi:glucokinase